MRVFLRLKVLQAGFLPSCRACFYPVHLKCRSSYILAPEAAAPFKVELAHSNKWLANGETNFTGTKLGVL